MKKRKSDPDDPVSTLLDPSHPNYDAILLKRARLEAHRRRRLENKGALLAPDRAFLARKAAKKPARRRDD